MQCDLNAYFILHHGMQCQQPLSFFQIIFTPMEMLHSLILSAADSHLGRANQDMISDSTRLELMLDACPCATKEKVLNTKYEECHDLKDWKGLTLYGNELTLLSWTFLSLEGTISFDHLPRTLKSFDITYNSFEGTVAADKLPHGLEQFLVGFNKLSGSIDFCKFPETLESIKLGSNKFHGSVDLKRLPPVLRHLHVHYNAFSGCVNLTALPDTLKLLSLAHNQFSGCLDITKLPQNMDELHLQQNNFHGKLDVAACAAQNVRIKVEEEWTRGDKEIYIPNGTDVYSFE